MASHAARYGALIVVGALVGPAFAEDPLQYNRDILPILSNACFECHGPDDAQRKRGLRLDHREGLFGDTTNGDAVIVPGVPEKSVLFARVSSPDSGYAMPPKDHRIQLAPDEIRTIETWIAQGAPWQKHWAFVPPKRATPPEVAHADWPRNAIDWFVLARIEEKGLEPSPEADKNTLIRRVTLDLTGLPPTPREVSDFLNDTSPNAYESLVDRLLASPRYGEHMAVSWLELARYADTDGYQNDRYRYMSVWRDWLIQALNANKPYDDFIVEQLAGDMLPNATLRQQIATGFGRNHRINSENGSIPEEWLVENVVDRVDTFGTAFLGLTMSCARCHDHKYDPISQKEYFRLFAHFNRVPEWGVGPNNGNSPPFVTVPASWPNLAPEENRRIEPEPYVLTENEGSVARPQAGSPETVMVMAEIEDPRPTYLLRRGLYDDPDTSEALAPGIPEVLRAHEEPIPANRLELARWLVKPDHPLTARVAVNRYWQHFFGTGIVKTADNFGLQGAYPTHPELLDWLATEFVRLDWDVKAFHKRIVTSATYRQASTVTQSHRARDPQNVYLARAPRVRLSAQQLRDQALYTGGLLVERLGGPSVKPYMPPGLWESVSNEKYDQGTGEDLYRRSMYTYWRRTTPPPMMTSFNAANREACSTGLPRTNSPLHALTLMNNTIFVESSRHLAEIMFAVGPGSNIQVRHGFLRVLARQPDHEEMRALQRLYFDLREAFANDPARAAALLDTGESPVGSSIDPVKLASMTLVASAILNLDEAIMRN